MLVSVPVTVTVITMFASPIVFTFEFETDAIRIVPADESKIVIGP